jgi:hypothetical protein
MLTTMTMAASVAPILLPDYDKGTMEGFKSGNATFECGQVASFLGLPDFMYAYKIDKWDQGDMNAMYRAEFEDIDGNIIHTNLITILNSTGTYFDWSATNSIGAVIVKAGNGANLFYYNPQVLSYSGLYGPVNNSLNPAEVSHSTFCWNPDMPMEYETAYAKGDAPTCFIGLGFGNWGWTNGPIGEGSYEWELWAAAGQCDTSRGTLVGKVTVAYADGAVTVTPALATGVTLSELHVYAGAANVPAIWHPKKGWQPTVAPGQYYIEDPLSGQIYVIVHAVVGIPK